MPETICRIFQDRAEAERAATQLREAGYARVDLLSVDAPAEGGGDATAEAKRRLGYFELPRTDVARFAAMLGQGRAAVLVRPPFGMALRAGAILDAQKPVAGGEPAPEEPIEVWTDATPFSRWLGLPLLSRNPRPMETMWGGRSTTRMRLASESWFSWKLLSSFSLSDRLRMPLLRKPGPVTEGMGMPLLMTRGTTISERFGMRALTGCATPLSSMLKLPTLTKSPTPFSDALGIKVEILPPSAAR